jgi:hypothetical protein
VRQGSGSHAPGTHCERNEKYEYFDDWRDPGHGRSNRKVGTGDFVRSLHTAAHGCTDADLQVRNRIAALKDERPAPGWEPALRVAVVLTVTVDLEG